MSILSINCQALFNTLFMREKISFRSLFVNHFFKEEVKVSSKLCASSIIILSIFGKILFLFQSSTANTE